MKPCHYVDEILVRHKLDCIARIDEYKQEGQAAFLHSRLIQDAVMRNLQTLAESSQRLSDTAKISDPTVPWRNISGMRNILVHDYLGEIDVDIVWETICKHLPVLGRALRRLLQHGEDNKS